MWSQLSSLAALSESWRDETAGAVASPLIDPVFKAFTHVDDDHSLSSACVSALGNHRDGNIRTPALRIPDLHSRQLRLQASNLHASSALSCKGRALATTVSTLRPPCTNPPPRRAPSATARSLAYKLRIEGL